MLSRYRDDARREDALFAMVQPRHALQPLSRENDPTSKLYIGPRRIFDEGAYLLESSNYTGRRYVLGVARTKTHRGEK